MKKAIFSYKVAVLVLLLGSVGCNGPSSITPPPQPNLLLVTLDTTRADRIGCYGYQHAETPHLDKLATEGVLFEQSIAVAPVTLPSHASILTGLYPPRHGVRDNADFRLPGVEITLAEHLKELGYATRAVVGSIILSSDLGLNQGFDVYDEPQSKPEIAPAGTRVEHVRILERPASEVTDSAIAILDRMQDGPFFLWVHYFDPHHDYAPPPPYSTRFAERLYDGEIAYTDAQLGRLLDELGRRGLAKNTLVAVTADHGESLGEHGENTHALFIYDSTILVPLILRLPGRIPADQRTSRLVSGVDLVPTLLELMGLTPMKGIHGKSFARAARGLPLSAREPVYAEAIYPERAYGWSALHALRDDETKFIEAPEPELYNLRQDPMELRNLAPRKANDTLIWKSKLQSILQEFGEADPSSQHPLDSEARERLASLGYISSGSPKIKRKDRPDPKHLVAQHNAFLKAKSLVATGHLEEAQSSLRQVLQADPENPAALALNGTLLFSAGQHDRGLTQLEEAARSSPGVFENQWNLANALHLSGKLPDAAQAYRNAISIHPFSAKAHFALGNVLYAMKDFTTAIQEYREAIRLGIDSPLLQAALGAALADSGDTARAELSLRKAVQADPTLARAWNKLGILVERADRKEEARQLYHKALESEPDFADALFNHAKVSLLLGDLETAGQEVEQLLMLHPSYPLTQYLKAHLCVAAGDKECAQKALQQFLKRSGESDPGLLEIAKKMLKDLQK